MDNTRMWFPQHPETTFLKSRCVEWRWGIDRLTSLVIWLGYCSLWHSDHYCYQIVEWPAKTWSQDTKMTDRVLHWWPVSDDITLTRDTRQLVEHCTCCWCIEVVWCCWTLLYALAWLLPAMVGGNVFVGGAATLTRLTPTLGCAWLCEGYIVLAGIW